MIYVINGLRTSDMLMIYANIIGLNYKGKRFFTSGRNYFEKSVYFDLSEPDELCTEFHDFLMSKNIIITDHTVTDAEIKPSGFIRDFERIGSTENKRILIERNKDYLIGPCLSDKVIKKLKSLIGSTNVRVLNFRYPLSKLYAKFKHEDFFTSMRDYNVKRSCGLGYMLCCMIIDQLNIKNLSQYPTFDLKDKITIELNDKVFDILPDWYELDEFNSDELKCIEDTISGL